VHELLEKAAVEMDDDVENNDQEKNEMFVEHDIEALVQDRLNLIAPALRAQIAKALEDGKNIHSARGLVPPAVAFKANAARHVAFNEPRELSSFPVRTLKRLQRSRQAIHAPWQFKAPVVERTGEIDKNDQDEALLDPLQLHDPWSRKSEHEKYAKSIVEKNFIETPNATERTVDKFSPSEGFTSVESDCAPSDTSTNDSHAKDFDSHDVEISVATQTSGDLEGKVADLQVVISKLQGEFVALKALLAGDEHGDQKLLEGKDENEELSDVEENTMNEEVVAPMLGVEKPLLVAEKEAIVEKYVVDVEPVVFEKMQDNDENAEGDEEIAETSHNEDHVEKPFIESTASSSSLKGLSGAPATCRRRSVTFDISDAEEKAATFRSFIRELYAHDPSKLKVVNRMLRKHVGQEEEIYSELCRRYGIMPKTA